MKRGAPVDDINEDDLLVGKPKKSAAGLKAVEVALERGIAQAGVTRTMQSMLRLNQRDGIDCPGCAWPESQGTRKPAEFCENGAKAIAEENTPATVDPGILGGALHRGTATQNGILAGKPRAHHRARWSSVPVTPTTPPSPGTKPSTSSASTSAPAPRERTVFYTSGRTANETAFMYQLFARSIGTNNLPDCSNMCHESSGSALNPTIGIGKGTVSLEDIHNAELIFVVGQNPGTNHPRMLSALADCKSNGGKIVAVNPLPEAGSSTSRTRSRINGVIGNGPRSLTSSCRSRWAATSRCSRRSGTCCSKRRSEPPAPSSTTPSSTSTPKASRAYRAARKELDWEETRPPPDCPGRRSPRLPRCWSSPRRPSSAGHWASPSSRTRWTPQGNHQPPPAAGQLRETGAGACPVRGHSNVQGDRTMGIWEKTQGMAPRGP